MRPSPCREINRPRETYCFVGKSRSSKVQTSHYSGDRLEFLVSFIAKEENLWKLKGKAQVDKETAAEGDIFLKVILREMGFEL